MTKDTLVVKFCNFLLNTLVSKEYTSKFALVVEHGLREAEAGKVPGLEKAV